MQGKGEKRKGLRWKRVRVENEIFPISQKLSYHLETTPPIPHHTLSTLCSILRGILDHIVANTEIPTPQQHSNNLLKFQTKNIQCYVHRVGYTLTRRVEESELCPRRKVSEWQ